MWKLYFKIARSLLFLSPVHSVGGWTVEAVEEHDTAKTALAICHRDENKTEGEEDARTEETAMIKAAARCKCLKNQTFLMFFFLFQAWVLRGAEEL